MKVASLMASFRDSAAGGGREGVVRSGLPDFRFCDYAGIVGDCEFCR